MLVDHQKQGRSYIGVALFVSAALYLLIPSSAGYLKWLIPILLYPFFWFGVSCLPFIELLNAAVEVWREGSPFPDLEFTPEELWKGQNEPHPSEFRVMNIIATPGDLFKQPHRLPYMIALGLVGLLLVLLPVAYLCAWGVGFGIPVLLALKLPIDYTSGASIRISMMLIVGLVFLPLMVPLVFLTRPLFSRPQYTRTGPRIDSISQPKVFELVNAICRNAGANNPEEIILDESSNVFVQAKSLRDLFAGKFALFIGLPVILSLSVGELSALLAHEIAHVRHGVGTRVWLAICGINDWLRRAVLDFDEWARGERNNRKFVDYKFRLFLPVAILSGRLAQRGVRVLWTSSRVLSAYFSRLAEIDADNFAVSMFGGKVFKSLLLKLILVEAATSLVHAEDLSGAGLSNPNISTNISDRAKKLPLEVALAALNKEFGRRRWFFDSHPTLKDRLVGLDQNDNVDKPEMSADARSLFINFQELCELVGRTSQDSALVGQVATSPINQGYSELDCWFCKTQPSALSAYVLLERQFGEGIKDSVSVQIPRCRRCAKKHKRGGNLIIAWYFLGMAFAFILDLLFDIIPNMPDDGYPPPSSFLRSVFVILAAGVLAGFAGYKIVFRRNGLYRGSSIYRLSHARLYPRVLELSPKYRIVGILENFKDL